MHDGVEGRLRDKTWPSRIPPLPAGRWFRLLGSIWTQLACGGRQDARGISWSLGERWRWAGAGRRVSDRCRPAAGMDRQTLRDWVRRYNGAGPARAVGQRGKGRPQAVPLARARGGDRRFSPCGRPADGRSRPQRRHIMLLCQLVRIKRRKWLLDACIVIGAIGDVRPAALPSSGQHANHWRCLSYAAAAFSRPRGDRGDRAELGRPAPPAITEHDPSPVSPAFAF